MNRSRFCITLFLTLTVVSISFPSTIPLNSGETSLNHFMAQDTTGPTIEEWNITRSAYSGQSFDVWAVVTDDESGVQNVSLRVRNSVNEITHYLMPYNGSHYTESIPALPINETYSLRVFAFDLANNTRNSYARNIDLRVTGPVIDPSVTMPIVVGSSLGLFALIVIIAYFYDKRQDAPRSIPQLSDSELVADS